MPKTSHGDDWATGPHQDMRKEWVAQTIENPYDQWAESDEEGLPVVVAVGAVSEAEHWIKVVLKGTSIETGTFHTAYRDRRLARKYGGRPWDILPPPGTRTPSPT